MTGRTPNTVVGAGGGGVRRGKDDRKFFWPRCPLSFSSLLITHTHTHFCCSLSIIPLRSQPHKHVRNSQRHITGGRRHPCAAGRRNLPPPPIPQCPSQPTPPALKLPELSLRIRSCCSLMVESCCRRSNTSQRRGHKIRQRPHKIAGDRRNFG
jgi:hypothetical protein